MCMACVRGQAFMGVCERKSLTVSGVVLYRRPSCCQQQPSDGRFPLLSLPFSLKKKLKKILSLLTHPCVSQTLSLSVTSDETFFFFYHPPFLYLYPFSQCLLLVAEWVFLTFFFPACLWAMAAHLFTEYILCCTVKMPSTFSTSTHSNYSSTYFENQEPELELFVQQQRTLQACFSLRKEDKKSFFLKKCGFQKAVSTNCVTPDTTCTIQYLTLRRGKPRMEHKNASLCVRACVLLCAFVSL